MFKKILKSITKSAFFQSIVAWTAALLMRIIYHTNRWRHVNESVLENYAKNKKPCIACFWHNRLGLMTFARRPHMAFHIMISAHADGKVISKTISHLGVKTIEGSTSKGSSEAVRKVIDTLSRGEFVGVTPDGPRGPRFSINPGLIRLAQKAGIDLLPVTYATTRRRVFNSWDRFILPLPFGRGVFVYGEPIKVNAASDIDASVSLLRERLIDISNQADKLCGHEAIPPAESVKAR